MTTTMTTGRTWTGELTGATFEGIRCERCYLTLDDYERVLDEREQGYPVHEAYDDFTGMADLTVDAGGNVVDARGHTICGT